ncbi:MAG: phage holin family protein [Bryobacter sp.]|jgi:putative membrane protein|nr:phage holin family protein [Bryobacter sp.]
MKSLLFRWALSAISLLVVAYVIPGISVDGVMTALLAAVVIGLVNGTLGLLLKVVTFPLTLLTLGLFWLIVNALMLMLAAKLVSGFSVSGFWAAFFGSILLGIVNSLLSKLIDEKK